MSINETKLDFWIKNNYNVLFIGKHGVGKTSCVLQAFNRANFKWKYFSASTLDPWVDVIGVPRACTNEHGDTYLDLVRPKEFANDEVEAVFFDEYNRSPKKVRNAVMELIQFKSINGKKFNNLKIIWAAINPEDDEQTKYDVEEIDPAQLDRFHVKVDVPYLPDSKYFTGKYGKELSDAAISWWKELPEEMQNQVSPRRLDYAIDMYQKEGDLRDVLPSASNITKLLLTLKSGPIQKQLGIASKNIEDAKKFISIENNYAAAIQYVIKNDKYMNIFLPLLSEEKLASLLAAHKSVMEYMASMTNQFPIFGNVITNIINANQSKKLVKTLKKLLPSTAKAKLTGVSYENILKNLQGRKNENTYDRKKIYDTIREELPALPTKEEAIETLNLLANIVNRSNHYTFSYSLKGIEKVVSNCFTTIAVADSITTPAEIILKYNPSWCIFDEKLTHKVKIQKPTVVQKVTATV